MNLMAQGCSVNKDGANGISWIRPLYEVLPQDIQQIPWTKQLTKRPYGPSRDG